MRSIRDLRSGLAGLAGLAVVLATPPPTLAQASGAEVWARTCARCHRMQPPTKYTAERWKPVVGHMALNARLTPEEEKAVGEFLIGAARKVSVEPTSEPEAGVRFASTDRGAVLDLVLEGREVFERQCVACHGKEGKGDGPAAQAFTPRPADLTNPERMGELTDAELREMISEGKGAMPGFSALLSPEELEAVFEYTRQLGAKEE